MYYIILPADQDVVGISDLPGVQVSCIHSDKLGAKPMYDTSIGACTNNNFNYMA